MSCQGNWKWREIIVSIGQRLMDMYNLIFKHFGPQNWWPAETRLEVVVGAVLTQNTNWKNVEKAIKNLKSKGLLDIEPLLKVDMETLSELIRPALYFRVKAKRLKNLIRFISERYGGDLKNLCREDIWKLRSELLKVNGIGPETADSILLYACNKPIFVVDAYTYRILERHGLIDGPTDYQTIQNLFMDHLPHDQRLFNEFHALIVMVGKRYCKRNPKCNDCPLEGWR